MSILDHAPAFNLDDAAQFVQTLYGLKASAKSLPSERDQNFLMQAENGERFVLKIANATEVYAMLEAQNLVMGYVANHVSFCPQVLQTTNGEEISSTQSQDGKSHFVRLATYLPGTPLGNVKHHSDDLLYDLGDKIGQLTNVLRGFDHPALHRDFHCQRSGHCPQEREACPG